MVGVPGSKVVRCPIFFLGGSGVGECKPIPDAISFPEPDPLGACYVTSHTREQDIAASISKLCNPYVYWNLSPEKRTLKNLQDLFTLWSASNISDSFIVWQRFCEPARLRIAYCLCFRLWVVRNLMLKGTYVYSCKPVYDLQVCSSLAPCHYFCLVRPLKFKGGLLNSISVCI